MAASPKQPVASVVATQALTPHDEALYESGKKLLVESVEVGREFCKFMITTSLGAIPTYIALLKLFLPEDHTLGDSQKIVIIPALAFLVSSILFVFGYFPKKDKLSLDLPDDIEQVRLRMIGRRLKFAWAGFIFLCLGIVLGACLLLTPKIVETKVIPESVKYEEEQNSRSS